MSPLGARGQRWLKVFHLVAAGLWLAGASILVPVSAFVGAADGKQLYGIHQTAKFIDDFVIIPAANCTLLSGILYALTTRWGWFKHRWIAAKWLVLVAGILFGTFGLGPCLNALPPLVDRHGLAALSDPAYQWRRALLVVGGLAQVASLLFAVILSVLKPWGARPATSARRPASRDHETAEVAL